MSLVFAVVLAALSLGAESLEGTWQLREVTEDGRPEGNLREMKWVFGKEKLTIVIDGQVKAENKFSSDPKASPPTVDLTLDGREMLGIYELKGDTLRICLPGRGNERRRPESFDKNPFRVAIVTLRAVAKENDLKPAAPKRLWEVEFEERAAAIAFSSDGKRIAIADYARVEGQNNLHLLDPANGKIVASFSDHDTPRSSRHDPSCLAFAPQTGHLATASASDVFLRDAVSGAKRFTLRSVADDGTSADQSVAGLQFSPDGQRLAVSLANGKVEIWNVVRRLKEKELNAGSASAAAAAFVRTARQVVTAERHNRVHLWDVAKGEALAELHPEIGVLRSVVVTRDGAFAAIGGEGGARLLAIDAKDSSLKVKAKLSASAGVVDTLVLSPEDRLLAASGMRGSVELFQPRTGKLLERLQWPRSKYPTLASFSPDGMQLVTCRRQIAESGPSSGVVVELWDVSQISTLPPLKTVAAWNVTDDEGGLKLIKEADGKFEPVEIDDRSGVTAEGGYLYFQVNDKLFFDLPDEGESFYLKMLLRDDRAGSFDVQYDSHITAPTHDGRWASSSTLRTTGKPEWRELSIELPRAKFANRQNGKADFRLRSIDGLVLELGGLTLAREAEQKE